MQFFTDTKFMYAASDLLALMKNLIDFLLSAMIYVGVIAFIFGVVQLAISFSSHDTSQRTQGVMAMIGGVVLIGIKALLTTLGVTV